MFAVGSFLFATQRRRLVDQQTNLETLRETSWKDFEYLVGEAYRRQGYQVEYSLSRGADGGVDLTMYKDGQNSLVQCKQWKVCSVGAPVVREMFGLMTAERPTRQLSSPPATSRAMPGTSPPANPSSWLTGHNSSPLSGRFKLSGPNPKAKPLLPQPK